MFCFAGSLNCGGLDGGIMIFQSFFMQMKSGVSQGFINGPKVFNCIMYELLAALQNEHLGCFINGRFVGALAYADDMLLLSSSLVMLQRMLDVCHFFGILYDLKFNPVETIRGVFGVADTSRLARVSSLIFH